jgi:serine/threonine protein kinase
MLADAKNALSVAYMSPETFTNGTVDSKSDIWALGCVLCDIRNVAPPRILKKEHDYSWHLRILPRWLRSVLLRVMSTSTSSANGKTIARMRMASTGLKKRP